MNKVSTQNNATSNKKSLLQKNISVKVNVNVELWNTITVILLLMSVFWHLRNVAGWWNGNTLVQVYGMDELLASAIGACPDILFYATHLSMATSIGFLIASLVLLVLFVIDSKDACAVLGPVMLFTIISIWAFPVFHAICDLLATAFEVRDTLDFDVFQLGIKAGPMLITTAVCFVIMQVNKRVNIII